MSKYQIQHNRIADAIQDVKTTGDNLFNKLHNGDAQLNNMLKSNRDAIMKAMTLFDSHNEDAADMGDELALAESSITDKTEALRRWRWLGGAGITILSGTIIVILQEQIKVFFA